VANIKSQIKRIRTNEKARVRNKSRQVRAEDGRRRFREVADSGDREATQAALRTAFPSLDKAASKGVIHANQAATRSPPWRSAPTACNCSCGTPEELRARRGSPPPGNRRWTARRAPWIAPPGNRR